MLTPQQVADKYHFFRVSPEGDYEMYADNHILSSLRTCEAYFAEGILNNIAPRGGRSWSLEFGTWMHKCLEVYYKVRKSGREYPLDKWLKFAALLWKINNLEHFKKWKQYKALGGHEGAIALLMQYYHFHYGWKEKLRIVGCELSFGFKKEVPIGTFLHNIDGHISTISCFLSGRIDVIVDDGIFIGPLDHKTRSKFSGDETSNYKPHDGMLGYAYAVDKILGEHFAKEGKQCRQTIVNHISLSNPKAGEDRFKRSFLQYTPGDFEDYRNRQLSTFKRMFELAVLNEVPQWNTNMCSNMYYNDCPYKELHKRPPETRDSIFKSLYEIRTEQWNPYRKDI